MNDKILKRTIIFNLILGSLIAVDLYFPGKVMPTQKLEYFYGTKRTSGVGRQKTMEFRNLISLSNGEVYTIGNYPAREIKNGEAIKIVRSVIVGNINSIIYSEAGKEKTITVSFFSKPLVCITYLISVLITVACLRYNNRVVHMALVLSTMCIWIISIVYLFCFK